MDNAQLLVLSGADVALALTMKATIPAMRGAFLALSHGRAQVPPRLNMTLAAGAQVSVGDALFMPVYQQDAPYFAVKAVTVMPHNPGRDLPLIHGLVTIFNSSTGQPVAVMDGEWLTAIRTGAASGLATDLLANQDAQVAAIFGCGVQAQTQLSAIAQVRRLRKVHVVGRDPQRTAAFCARVAASLHLVVEPASAREALREADIVCTATPATTPLFETAWLKPGCHINAVGSYRKDMCEIPPAAVGAARVVVDSLPACLAEAGEVVLALAAGLLQESQLAELGQVLAGEQAGRTNAEEITLFKSVGNAVQDLAAACLALEGAQRLGLGVSAPL